MALDGIFLNRLVNHLKEVLIDGKIDKVNQPEKDEIILTIRKNRINYKLLISASSNYSRMHFTEIAKENPLKAPIFLMVLRKYLTSSKIIDVYQKEGDRVVVIKVQSRDELGFDSEYSLIVEIMGRHSNITLVRSRDNKIMESIKHITPDINSYRVLYPGATYKEAPPSTKLNPFSFSLNTLNSYIEEHDLDINEDFFFKTFTGVSKPYSKELYSFLNNKDNIYDFCKKEFDNTPNEFNIITTENGYYKDFYFKPLKSVYPNSSSILFEDPSKMLEEFFKTKDKQERLTNRSLTLAKLVTTNIDRCKKKEQILLGNIKEGEKKSSYKIKGDLLTSYIYMIKGGMDTISLLNFFNEDEEEYMDISLVPHKSPSENIQNYYKKYNKLKKSEEWATGHLKENNEEIAYLNSVLSNIANVENYKDIDEIRNELVETGYIKFKSTKKGGKKEKESSPIHFLSSQGVDIYVGKNNIQNDYLSLKFANKNDLWLHTKNIPGSHVIIKGIPDSITLEEAGIIASFYSKGKNNSKVQVDYTEVRNLKKPNGAKPGMVIYYTNKTLTVDPMNFNKLNITKL